MVFFSATDNRPAIEIAPRPPGADERIRWASTLPARIRGLVIASEWLDNIPVDVAELTPDGPRIMLVDPGSGAEQPGPAAGPAEQEWLRQWWPLAASRRARRARAIPAARPGRE